MFWMSLTANNGIQTIVFLIQTELHDLVHHNFDCNGIVCFIIQFINKIQPYRSALNVIRNKNQERHVILLLDLIIHLAFLT